MPPPPPDQEQSALRLLHREKTRADDLQEKLLNVEARETAELEAVHLAEQLVAEKQIGILKKFLDQIRVRR